MRPALAAFLMSVIPISAAAEPRLFDVAWREIKKGVFVGGRDDPLRYPVVANTTIVIGKKGVLVFDGGGYAAQGEQVLAKIRAETKKPVTHLVISHWHGDHHRGAHPIIDAFPDAEIIAHEFACAAMLDGPERRVEEGEAGLDGLYKEISAAVERGKWFDGSELSEPENAYFARMVADFPEYKAQLARMKVLTPTMAPKETITIDLGKRKATLFHAGLGNTAGDLALYLPKEGLLATGDIVVAPVPYGFGSYPKEWARVIRQFAALPVGTIVPGHGAIMTDKSYLLRLAELLEDIARQADAANSGPAGATPETDFAAHEPAFTQGDPVKARLFAMFFKEPIVAAAANEARGEIAKNEPLDGDASALCPIER
ncbi:MAG: MBL fold metallo-hydrolase [Parvularculaceae bacterium]|nr:MBL fold metallo-hydrolase [Parvularculaceae bacterium]